MNSTSTRSETEIQLRGLPNIAVNPIPKFKRQDIHIWDRLFSWSLKIISLTFPAVLALIGIYLFREAAPAIDKFGWSFLTDSIWDPVNEVFGAAPVIFGTIVSSMIAVILAAPLSLGVALFLNEIVPQKIARIISFLVEMLAAIPSVVYGLWGIFVLAPWVRTHAQPFLEKWLGFLPLFRGPHYGVGMLTAGVILAIMITPTIFALSREVFNSIPTTNREAALALGATRWEMMKIAILKGAKSGIGGAIILGLGRALGETMAVTMVIGNRAQISASLFDPSQTMASVIANEYAEATSKMHLSALIEVGFVLFAVTFIMNSLARAFLLKGESPHK